METVNQPGAIKKVADLKPHQVVDSRRLVAIAFTSWMPPEGVAMKITNPVKTVVDGIRYRGKIGFAVALEALRECMRQRRCPKNELLKCAKVCRMTRIMRPYLEALA